MKPQQISKQFATIEGRALRAALTPIQRVIERRNTYPILSMVRITVAGPTLTLSGTDLDIEITTQLDMIEAGGDWSMCVSPKILSDIARLAGAAPVRIERAQRLSDGLKPAIDYECVVTIGDEARYTLTTFDADGFPDLAGERGSLIERFTNGMLVQMLDKVAPYISTEETRYYLNGVHWVSTDGKGRRLQATDGHRLGTCSYAAAEGAVFSRIIPRKAVSLIRAVAGGQDVSVYSVAGREVIELTFGRTTIRTKLIEGTFPDTDRVTPAPAVNPIKLELNRTEILAAIDRASVVGSNRYGRAIRWFGQDGKLALSVTSAEQGNAEAVTATDYPVTATDFGLNAKYIRGIIASCEGAVTMHIKDAGAPFLITDEDTTMTRVCMPMRV